MRGVNAVDMAKVTMKEHPLQYRLLDVPLLPLRKPRRSKEKIEKRKSKRIEFVRLSRLCYLGINFVDLMPKKNNLQKFYFSLATTFVLIGGGFS